MNNYQLTYEDALRICEAYKNFNFYKTETIIEGYKVVTFNYFICDYNMFANPLKDDSGITAFDMRGVTFVFDMQGVWKRYYMLEKFFNLNQVANTQFDVLKDKKIRYVTIKEDGSLIAFMKLPNGKIFSKTQGGFDNDQAINAMSIYNDNEAIKNIVDKSLNEGMTPLFEYVAYDNRIVLKYQGRGLRLIGFRKNLSGRFYSAAEMICMQYNKLEGLDYVKFLYDDTTLEELVERSKKEENIEGWVVEFYDHQMIKIKTEWYFNLHGIRTMNIFREDFVIEHYLNESLDNVTQDLSMIEDADAFKFINHVKNAVDNWMKYIDENVDELVNIYNSTFYFNNWAKFATDKHKAAFFGLARTKIEQIEMYSKKKVEYMLAKAYHLMDAKSIVDKFKK